MYLEYTYKALSTARSIRAIEIAPGTHFDDELKCSMLEITFDETEKPSRSYNALSYAWGTSERTSKIECDSHFCLVTPNCQYALQSVRGNKEPLVIWVDAICINQSDITERNAQVRMMDNIYRKADITFVSLGPWLRDEGFLKRTKLLGRIRDASGPLAPMMNNLMGKMSQPKSLVYRLEEELGPGHLDTRSPWTHRMWTLQEFCLARKPVIVCGRVHFPLDTFLWQKKAKSSKGAMPPLQDLPPYDIRGEWSNNHWTTRVNIRTFLDTQTPSTPLYAYVMLDDARQFRSGDPRDKVFGLYGLLKQLGVHPPEPDYNKTTEEVYLEIVRAAILETKSLNLIICSTPRGQNPLQLPSWIPDWSQGAEGSDSPMDVKFANLFRACKDDGYSGKIQANARRLVLTGKILGRIRATVDPPQPRAEGEPVNPVKTVASWVQLAFKNNPSEEREITKNELAEKTYMFYLTLFPEDTPAPGVDGFATEDLNKYLDYLDWMCDGEDLQTLYKLWCFQRGIPRPYKHKPNASNFAKRLPSTNYNDSRFFCLDNLEPGFGTSNTNAAEGDVVVIAQGATVPLVLRKLDDTYALIGASYVPGVMHGEVWDSAHSLQEFVVG